MTASDLAAILAALALVILTCHPAGRRPSRERYR